MYTHNLHNVNNLHPHVTMTHVVATQTMPCDSVVATQTMPWKIQITINGTHLDRTETTSNITSIAPPLLSVPPSPVRQWPAPTARYARTRAAGSSQLTLRTTCKQPHATRRHSIARPAARIVGALDCHRCERNLHRLSVLMFCPPCLPQL